MNFWADISLLPAKNVFGEWEKKSFIGLVKGFFFIFFSFSRKFICFYVKKKFGRIDSWQVLVTQWHSHKWTHSVLWPSRIHGISEKGRKAELHQFIGTSRAVVPAADGCLVVLNWLENCLEKLIRKNWRQSYKTNIVFKKD